MKFTETRRSMQRFQGATTPDYQLEYISKEVKGIISELNYQFVEHLAKDISQHKFDVSIKSWLGSTYYSSSNELAKECLEISPLIEHLWGRKIKGWTDNALKCFDNFLLKYIQEDLQEVIPKRRRHIYETDVYNHLISKGDLHQKVGQSFANIYQERNNFHHIQVEERDGKRIPLRMNTTRYNRRRDLIFEWFRDALIALDELIENE